MFENIRSDYRANGSSVGNLGFWALVIYRFGRWRYSVRPVIFIKPLSLLYRISFKAIQIAIGIELPCEAEIGRGFVIDHFGGIVISGYARFGNNCRVRPGVVVGLSHIEDPCAPVIGDNVDIGAGAKLLGSITIGNNVLIGANAVVIKSVPSDCVAVGVPAKIRRRRGAANKAVSNTHHHVRHALIDIPIVGEFDECGRVPRANHG